MSVHSVMADQHGLITLAQAASEGLTRRQVDARLQRGQWVRVERAVYRHSAVHITWESRLLAACLTSGGLASHRCAAALWRLDQFWTPRVEVVISQVSSYRSKHHRIHRSTQWDRTDQCTINAIPCTGIERTILDLAAVVSLRRVELAAESAMRLGLIDWPALRECLIRHSRQGRDGCGRLRLLLDSRHGDDPLPLSAWSRLVQHILSDAGVPEPKLEYPILNKTGRILTRVDLAWPDHLVALELDSVRYHLNRRSFEKDKRKRNKARLMGWTIHEVTWSMSVEDKPGLVRLIKSALRLRNLAS